MDLPEPDDRLNSWKEIAAFLGRTVRTVQRWEKVDRLPVRRGGPGQRGAVVASRRELAAWWEGRRTGVPEAVTAGTPAAQRPDVSPRWRRLLPAALVAIALAAVSGPIFCRRAAPPEMPSRLGRLFATSTSEGRAASFIPLSATPSDVVVAPSGRVAYVALYEGAVAIVDLRKRKVIDRLYVMGHPDNLALSSDGGRLIVSGASELVVVDLRLGTVTRHSPVDGIIRDLYLSADGRYLWMTLAQAGLKVLDLETGRVDTVPTIGCPMYITAAPRSRRLFVSYQCGGPGGRGGHDAIEMIDEPTRTSIVSRAGVPLVGSTLALSPDERHLWADTADACAHADYDHTGCPPGSGPVLHAFRTDTLDALLTVRLEGSSFQSRSAFFPDGTRLVVAGPEPKVIDRSLGTIHETITRRQGIGTFTADGQRLVTLDPVDQGLVQFELSPPPDISALGDATTHWTGDGTANDVVGGTHAVRTGGIRFHPGRYGQAFAFDDTSEGVGFGRRLEANIADQAATYAAWIKPGDTGRVAYIASRTTQAGWRWTLASEGQMYFCLADAPPEMSCAGGGLLGRTALEQHRWYHVAVVRSESAMRLFVDGREDASVAVTLTRQIPDPGWDERQMRLGAAAQLRLGAGIDGQAPFHGLIDEVLMFRRALTAEDLRRVMRATSLDPIRTTR